MYCSNCSEARLLLHDPVAHELLSVRVCALCLQRYAQREATESAGTCKEESSSGETEETSPVSCDNGEAQSESTTVDCSAFLPSALCSSGAPLTSALPSFSWAREPLLPLLLSCLLVILLACAPARFHSPLLMLLFLSIGAAAFLSWPALARRRALLKQQCDVRVLDPSPASVTICSITPADSPSSCRSRSTSRCLPSPPSSASSASSLDFGSRSQSPCALSPKQALSHATMTRRRANTADARDTRIAPIRPHRKSLPPSCSYPLLSPAAEVREVESAAADIPSHLSPADAEIVRRSRIGLVTVESYHSHASGWQTKRITRPDGTGSVKLTPALEHAQYDLQHTSAADLPAGDTVVIQCKTVRDPFNPSVERRVWKGVGVVRAPPDHLFRLFADEDRQAEWNAALLSNQLLRTISGTRTSITYAVSAPAVGGAVSSREFLDTHEWRTWQHTDPATGAQHTSYIYAGVGVEEPIFNHPRNSKYIRGINGPAGFLMLSIEPPPADAAVVAASGAADSGASGDSVSPPPPPPPAPVSAVAVADRWTLFVMVVDVQIRGWLPKSLTDGSMPDVILEYFTNFRRVWKKRQQENTPLPPMPPDTFP